VLRQAPPSAKWSWDLPDPPPPQRGVNRSAAPDQNFRRTVLFTIAGTAIPGLGLIAARRQIVGSVILGVFATSILALGIYASVDLQALLAYAVDPKMLRRIGVALVVIGLVWVGVVIASHLALRGQVNSGQRAAGAVLVGILAFAVAAPLAVASRYSYDQASLVGTVFKSEKQSKSATRPTFNSTTAPGQQTPQDPWAGKPRLNILLLGGDADRDRVGTRTDTVILASINTKTGDTALFSLPRNTARMPFPARSPLHKYYPYGFTNGNGGNAEYFLNAMYMNVPERVPKDVLGETDNLGADALKLSVGEALGLKVDYYVLINLQGFSRMINALGGIRVNVNTYIPIGGNTDRHIPPDEYISPGRNKHLHGREALWFARGRYGSDDYARMDRQRCVINAIIRQANPGNVLRRYESIAKAGKQLVYTDMPQEVLPLIVELSLRVKNGNVRSIVFKTGVSGFISANPDYDTIRKRVKTALGETKKIKSSSATAKPSGGGKDQSTESDDINASCAFDPKVAATSRPIR
jgi:LCP family protein required for cell wall assembly